MLSPLLSHEQKPPTRASALRTHPDVAGTTLCLGCLQMWRRPPHAERGGIRYSRVWVLVEVWGCWPVNLTSVIAESAALGNLCVPGSLCHHWPQAMAHKAFAWWRSASSGSLYRSGLPRPQSRDNNARSVCDRGMGKARTRMWCVDTSRAHPGGSSAHPQPGSARFPPASASASSFGQRSKPLVQLSKQGVSLSFWLTKSQRGTRGP